MQRRSFFRLFATVATVLPLGSTSVTAAMRPTVDTTRHVSGTVIPWEVKSAQAHAMATAAVRKA